MPHRVYRALEEWMRDEWTRPGRVEYYLTLLIRAVTDVAGWFWWVKGRSRKALEKEVKSIDKTLSAMRGERRKQREKTPEERMREAKYEKSKWKGALGEFGFKQGTWKLEDGKRVREP